jgi:hypothetical protein
VQAADADGKVTFTSIFPACYAGRWPHVHFEVYPALGAATAAGSAIHTSQLALPEPLGSTPPARCRPRGVVSPAQARAALEAFQRAVETGDLQGLLDLLAPDVVALSDGSGVKQAVLRPIVGAERVARLVAAAVAMVGAELSLEPALVNGSPALIVRLNGELDSVVAVRVEGGLVTALYTVRNPEKLSHMERETALSR